MDISLDQLTNYYRYFEVRLVILDINEEFWLINEKWDKTYIVQLLIKYRIKILFKNLKHLKI